MERYYQRMVSDWEQEKRIIDEAEWYLDHQSSVRDVAENFDVGKTTVWVDFTRRLQHIDMELYDRVKYLLSYNKKHAVEKMNAANALRK